uniref:Claudin-23-like protein n=1 Tax=Callorhinchus milii TaxID=7868 RepID=V9L8R9_CALMI
MRTPPVMILGLVLSPAGFVLILVSTVAPAWRDVSNIPTDALDTVLHQGLWEICREKESVRETTCGVADVAYFQHQVLGLSRGLMIAGLVVTALGVLLSSLGVRCWTQHPNLAVSGAGGVVLGVGGVLTLIAVSWYTDKLQALPNSAAGQSLSVGYSIVLGFIGGCLEILGGLSLAFSFGKLCEQQRAKAKPYVQKKKEAQRPAKLYPRGISNPVQVVDIPAESAPSAPWDADL